MSVKHVLNAAYFFDDANVLSAGFASLNRKRWFLNDEVSTALATCLRSIGGQGKKRGTRMLPTSTRR
jgi:hypothetical protein